MKILISVLSVAFLASCQSGTKKESNTNDNKLESKIDTTITVKTPEIAPIDPWQVNTFVDDFGEKSDGAYVKTISYGAFSNSATSNEYLKVELLLTLKNAGLFLHEYSESNPAQKFIGTGKIRLRNEKGTDLTIYSYTEWNQQGGLSINNSDFKKLRDFLLSSKGEIKAVVFDEYSSTYNFSFSTDTFDKHFAEIKTTNSKN